jgi:large subunit ribosomal protein L10
MPTKAPAGSAQMQRKSAVIDDIKARLVSSDAAVLTEYRGLTVRDIASLRAALRPAATDYKIFKNTLARRAAHDAGLDDIVESFEGPIAIAFVRRDGGDAVTAAKALRDFARTNPNLVLKGGILGLRLLSSRDVEALADVPPREQLLARLAGGFQAPMVKAAGLFQAFTRNMAYGVKALIDQRIAAGEALPAEPAAETDAPAESTENPAPATEKDAPATENPAPATENPAPATENDAPAADAAEPAQASEEEEE